MARNGFLLLVLLNLLFFGWSSWIAGRDAPPPAPTAIAAAASPAPPPPPPAPPACTTVGPYETEDAAFAVAAKLAASGRATALRSLAEPAQDGYWVYLDGFPDTEAQRVTIDRIKGAGIEDASAMPGEPPLRVSVGLFSERARAEQRAAAVRRLKLTPQVGEHQGTRNRYWIDMTGIAPQDVGPEVLLGAGIDNVPGELVACP